MPKGHYYSEKQEIKALQKEVNNCSEQMEALRREFKELKKEVETTWKEVDMIRSMISEYVSGTTVYNK